MLRSALTVFALAGALVFAAGVGQASAAQPCWRAVINDWYDNGLIDAQYQVHCYREALQHAPGDLRMYSDLPEKVGRALQTALRSQSSRSTASRHVQSVVGSPSKHGPIARVLSELGPKRADSLPVPLLILAAFALLLIGAGAAGMVTRKLASRRVRPGPPD